MASLLNIGAGALQSFQTALNTTSNNIANVNTEGFTRQVTNFDTLGSQGAGGIFVGSGVAVDSIQRVYDQFLFNDVVSRTSNEASASTFFDLASRLESFFANNGTGFQTSLDNFYSALQDVVNNPSSIAERQALIGQAEDLVQQHQSVTSGLDALNTEVTARVRAEVEEINLLSESIAEINSQFVGNTENEAPSELVDERNRLVEQLAGRISINTVTTPEGTLNVSFANGASLVTGAEANALTLTPNEFDPFALEIGIEGRVGSLTDTGRNLGGSLGGALQFQNELLQATQNNLGLIAASISESFNAQHQEGIDLEGNLGQSFFNDLQLSSITSNDNTGSATVSVALTDINQLTADDYLLSFNGTDYQLTNLTTNEQQTGAGPFLVNGLEITPTGAANAGDSFLIAPTQSAGLQFAVEITDPRAVAAGTSVRADQALSNVGSINVNSLNVTDTATLPLAADIELTFNPDALGAGIPGFDVTGIAAGPIAFDPATQSGQTLSVGGFEITVDGIPETGDTISIVNNAGGVGDNSNALSLLGLQQSAEFLNGSATQQDLYASTVADVGSRTSRVQSVLQTEQALLSQAQQALDSVAGVNLDEEAADLLRFQQSFQAAAQIVSVATDLFNILLSATSR